MNDPMPSLDEHVDEAKDDTPMTGLEKARFTLLNAGLVFPQIPRELADQLQERQRWVFSTREVKMWPYDLHLYVEENYNDPAPYVVLANAGYGCNCYILAYYLVFGPLSLFLHLSWGGIYSNAEEDAAQIKECFSLADRILLASMASSKLIAGERITIVSSDSYDSHWGLSLDGGIRRSSQYTQPPAQFLSKVLDWLNDPKPRKRRTNK